MEGFIDRLAEFLKSLFGDQPDSADGRTGSAGRAGSARFRDPDMQEAWAKGDVARAARINDRLAPLHDALFCETSPAPCKFGTALLGKTTPDVRLPLVAASPEAQEKMRVAMRGAGVLN